MARGKRIITVLVLGISMLLSGCSSGGTKNASGPVTLYWWNTRSDASEETLKEMVKQYGSMNKSVKIEVVSKDPRTYEEDVLQALAAHQSVQNAPDIFSIDVEDLPKYAPQLAPAPDDLFNTSQNKNENTGKNAADSVGDVYEDVVAKSTVLQDASGNPKLYGLPIALDSLALYINRSLIDKTVQNLKSANKIDSKYSANELSSIIKQIQTPPKTWTELTKIVPFLTSRDGDEISQSAIALGTGANVERSYDILSSMMLQNGTQMTSADMGSAAFNLSSGSAASSSTPGLRALDFYLQFSDPSSALYSWNSKMPNDVEAFEQGQVAMIIHYADLYRFLISEAPSLKSSIDVAPLPQIIDPNSPLASGKVKTTAKMQVQVAPSAKGDAVRQKAAWDFIKYVSSKQGATTYLSAMKLTSPIKGTRGNPKFEAFATQKPWADLWYKGHKSLEIDQIFISMIENASSKKSSSQEALGQAAKDTSTILQSAKTKWVNSGGSGEGN
ncbi:MAG: extracellular solute-binding protein [bacterium]